MRVRQHSPLSITSLEDLNMISKLRLVRELEKDTRDALKDMNVEHDSQCKLKIGKNKQALIETAKITTEDLDTSYVV